MMIFGDAGRIFIDFCALITYYAKKNNEVHSNDENLIFGGGRVNHQCVLSFRLRLWLNLKFEVPTSTKIS